MKKKEKKEAPEKRCGCVFVAEYRHYLTKKIMKAIDYGYKAWCLRKCASHR